MSFHVVSSFAEFKDEMQNSSGLRFDVMISAKDLESEQYETNSMRDEKSIKESSQNVIY